jgi:hypothetical protein
VNVVVSSFENEFSPFLLGIASEEGDEKEKKETKGKKKKKK